METLNMWSRGYIYQQPYDDIKIVFRNHSRDVRKKGRSSQGLVSSSSSALTIKHDIGSMLEDFKSQILHTSSLEMDNMQIKRKQEEAEMALVNFFPRCTKRHPRNECPLNVIEVYSFCEENHATNKCPSLPCLKVVCQGIEGGLEHLFFINQRRPQGPWPCQQGMQGAHYPNQNSPFQPWYHSPHPSWTISSPFPYVPQYPLEPINPPFQPYPPQSP